MKNLSINIKLILLVGLGLVFIAAVVVIETISNSSIERTNDENFAKIEQANHDYREKALTAQGRLNQVQEVLNSVQYARIAEKSYLQFYNPKYGQQLEEHVNHALDALNKLDKNQSTETLATTLQSYQQDFGKIINLHHQIEGLTTSLGEQFEALKTLLSKSEATISETRFEKQMMGEDLSPAEAQFGTMVAQGFRTVDFIASMRSQFLLTDNASYINTLTEHFKTKMGAETASIRQTAKALKEPVFIQTAEYFKEVVNNAYDQTLATQKIFNQEKETSERLNEYGTVLTETGTLLLKTISDQMNTERNASVEKVENAKENRTKSLYSAKKTVTWVLVIALGTGVLILALLATFIIRSITKPLKRAIDGFTEGSDQVAVASLEVSRSSQHLAEGSSEQAASIEETSSSLEEMSSMTKQTADNANQANSLMKEANQVVKQANDSMNELTASMEGISKASEETSKIIKTIDEIAFQTNLLALNAAVEAARAGEAGAGFAVVADEVRNLAMRAADAAKNTADLIEGTVKEVGDGSELVTKTNEAFVQVADSTKKVGELVGEIAAASNEQADGIGQVNKAVTEMDKVVQQNAANAEESASASEEMTAQAEQMRTSVTELVALVGGSAKGTDRMETNSIQSVGHQTQQIPTHRAESKQLVGHKESEVNPDQVIPMNDDFKNF